MSVLIVVESHFGNTLALAHAIAAGIARERGDAAVTVQRTGEASATVPPEVTLLLAGAPTHNLGLPNDSSRKQAAEKGASHGEPVGLREWIARLAPRPDLRMVTFDTTTGSGWSGSAAKAASKQLRRLGFRAAERGPSFTVTGTSGPLADGERERAAAWGAVLAASLH